MSDSVRILAIDPGSHCGYCVMTIPKPVPPHSRTTREGAGIWNLQQKRFEGAGMRFVRLRKFIAEVNPDFVVYEQVQFRHKSSAAAAVYWGCVSAITSYCDEFGINYAAIATNDLKRRATGKGGGKGTKKPDIIMAANTFFNLNPAMDESDQASNHDHDIADAMWLMQIAIEEYASSVVATQEPPKNPPVPGEEPWVITYEELLDSLNSMSDGDLKKDIMLCDPNDCGKTYKVEVSIVEGELRLKYM